jgi:hypothetical protein
MDVGKITTADFILLGNELAFQNNPPRRAQLEETSRQILLTAVFAVEHGPPLDRTVFRADVSGPDLVLEFFRQQLVRMDGGPDLRPVDGEGFLYSYPVPEPATALLLLGGCTFIGCRPGNAAIRFVRSIATPHRPSHFTVERHALAITPSGVP